MRRLWFTSIQDLSLLAVIDNGHMVVIYEDDHHSWQFRNHKAITGIYIWKCFVVVKLLSFHRKPNRLKWQLKETSENRTKYKLPIGHFRVRDQFENFILLFGSLSFFLVSTMYLLKQINLNIFKDNCETKKGFYEYCRRKRTQMCEFRINNGEGKGKTKGVGNV